MSRAAGPATGDAEPARSPGSATLRQEHRPMSVSSRQGQP